MDVSNATETAQIRANQYKTPFIVAYDKNGYHVVRGSDYRFEEHGVIERIRYHEDYDFNRDRW